MDELSEIPHGLASAVTLPEGRTLGELAAERPLLLVFLRHPG